MTKAKFWIRYKGTYIMLCLRPCETFAVEEYDRNDEGFCSEYRVYCFNGKTVTLYTHIAAQDCDGRHAFGEELVCEYNNLQSHHVEHWDEPLPLWEPARSYQRDYTAESMGY